MKAGDREVDRWVALCQGKLFDVNNIILNMYEASWVRDLKGVGGRVEIIP